MRVGEFACIGDASAWSAWLDVAYMRTVAYDYARLRVRVVSFASLRVVSSRSSVSLLCVHVRGRVDGRLRLLRLRDSWVRWYLRYLRMCMFAVR